MDGERLEEVEERLEEVEERLGVGVRRLSD